MYHNILNSAAYKFSKDEMISLKQNCAYYENYGQPVKRKSTTSKTLIEDNDSTSNALPKTPNIPIPAEPDVTDTSATHEETDMAHIVFMLATQSLSKSDLSVLTAMLHDYNLHKTDSDNGEHIN